MTTRLVSCILVVAALGCGEHPPADEWDGAVARAVARRTAAHQPERTLVVLGTVAGPDGETLPWAVRQSLATGGIEMGDTSTLHDPATVTLVFDRSIRDGPDWHVQGRLLHGAGAGVEPDAEAVTWHVRCDYDDCVVIGTTTGPGRDAGGGT